MKIWYEKTTSEESKIIWKNYFFRLFLGGVSIILLNILFLFLFQSFISDLNHYLFIGITDIFSPVLYILGFISIISLLIYLFSYLSQLYFQLVKRTKKMKILTIKYIHKVKIKNQTRYIVHTDEAFIDSHQTVIFNLKSPFEQMNIDTVLLCESIDGRSDILSLEILDKRNAELNPEFSIHNNN